MFDIEKKLSAGIVTELLKATYIKNNTIPVIEFKDNTAERKKKFAVVHAKPARRMDPVAFLWEVEVEIIAITHIPDDKDCTILENIYGDAFTLLNTISTTTIGTASTLTIAGIVPSTEQGEDSIMDAYQTRNVKAKFYLQKSS